MRSMWSRSSRAEPFWTRGPAKSSSDFGRHERNRMRFKALWGPNGRGWGPGPEAPPNATGELTYANGAQ
jgi:hypothetical protein